MLDPEKDLAMCEEATGPPWKFYVWSNSHGQGDDIEGMPSSLSKNEEGSDTESIFDIVEFTEEHRALPIEEQMANAKLIAAARTLLPEYIRDVVKLREDVGRLREALDDIMAQTNEPGTFEQCRRALRGEEKTT